MIKSLELKNIQSHKETKLEFNKGINAIVGSSNNGKTTIIRALNWARYNRPLGIDTLASHWIMNEDGSLKNEMSVTVENDNHTITRKRTKKDNQYIVDDEILNVVKTDVPVSVENALRLTETNIQNQLDAPFLLSETSGKVAEYFNKVVRLDVIDRVLTKAETTRRKTNQEIQSLENTIKENEKKLESFDWMDKVEKILIKLDRLIQKNQGIKQEISTLEYNITRYQESLKNQYDFNVQTKIINKIEKEKQSYLNLEKENNDLAIDVNNYLWHDKKYPDFTSQKKIIEEIESFDNENLQDEINNIQDSVSTLMKLKSSIKETEKDIEYQKTLLPEICPICGSKMKDGECIL